MRRCGSNRRPMISTLKAYRPGHAVTAKAAARRVRPLRGMRLTTAIQVGEVVWNFRRVNLQANELNQDVKIPDYARWWPKILRVPPWSGSWRSSSRSNCALPGRGRSSGQKDNY